MHAHTAIASAASLGEARVPAPRAPVRPVAMKVAGTEKVGAPQ